MNKSITLDAVDRRILDVLQTDCARSNLQLAAAAHTSPATCLRRVARLVASGVIERRVAIVSPEAVGAGLTAIVELSLEHQGAEHLAAFESRAIAAAEVQQCHRVSPGPDFVLLLRVRDMAQYHALVQTLFTHDANVRNVKSYFSVHRAKFETRVPLTSSPAPSP